MHTQHKTKHLQKWSFAKGKEMLKMIRGQRWGIMRIPMVELWADMTELKLLYSALTEGGWSLYEKCTAHPDM